MGKANKQKIGETYRIMMFFNLETEKEPRAQLRSQLRFK